MNVLGIGSHDGVHSGASPHLYMHWLSLCEDESESMWREGTFLGVSILDNLPSVKGLLTGIPPTLSTRSFRPRRMSYPLLPELSDHQQD